MVELSRPSASGSFESAAPLTPTEVPASPSPPTTLPSPILAILLLLPRAYLQVLLLLSRSPVQLCPPWLQYIWVRVCAILTVATVQAEEIAHGRRFMVGHQFSWLSVGPLDLTHLLEWCSMNVLPPSQVVNVWRSTSRAGPVACQVRLCIVPVCIYRQPSRHCRVAQPLAVLDCATLAPSSLFQIDLVFADRVGQNLGTDVCPEHQWCVS